MLNKATWFEDLLYMPDAHAWGGRHSWTSPHCLIGLSPCTHSPSAWLSGEGHLPPRCISILGPHFLLYGSIVGLQAWNAFGTGECYKIGARWFEIKHILPPSPLNTSFSFLSNSPDRFLLSRCSLKPDAGLFRLRAWRGLRLGRAVNALGIGRSRPSQQKQIFEQTSWLLTLYLCLSSLEFLRCDFQCNG